MKLLDKSLKIFLDVLYKVLMENKNIVESNFMVVLILEIELIVKFLEMEFELFLDNVS